MWIKLKKYEYQKIKIFESEIDYEMSNYTVVLF